MISEIQETFGGSYNVPDDFNEEELIVDMGMQTETRGPAYLQLDEGRIWMQSLICLHRQHPAGHATEPAGRSNAQAEDELGLLAVPRAKEITYLLS
ncbi:hypothetical protein NL676_037449 [Syzygium grande]|nr:hypothetical protein NL676_037449 [Syzygium grande]